MIQGKWFPVGADISQALDIRASVFGRRRDASDDMAQQAVVYGDTGEAVGSARLLWRDGAFWLGDIGVLERERGRGYGDLLVRLLMYKALTHGARRMALVCPSDMTGFFARYGFKPTGDCGEGVEMSADADDISLSHCGGCGGCRE